MEVAAFKVPSDSKESDGTLEWDSATLVLVRLGAGRTWGCGYSYAHEGCVPLIRDKLFPILQRGNVMDVKGAWNEMNKTVRNLGKRGVAATAIAAVDIALWDLKARLLEQPLIKLLGQVRDKIAVYGSGGFTSYSEKQLRSQFGHWAEEGISMFKMKVGREDKADARRVRVARKTIGRDAELFVDANGAYTAKQSLRLADEFAAQGVTWFEEPVSSDNLDGLRFVRERVPAGMEVSAGEYNFDCIEARRMLEAGAVDVLQADATRCGITGFLQAAELCDTLDVPLSSHTSPALHAHLCCAATRARHAEYFHDHVRIEQMFFDGATVRQKDGFLQPDSSQPGLGLEFKHKDAAKFEIKI
jgi:L-alanine-DL-glutamate epimerase-like enolase superfamily enzyme